MHTRDQEKSVDIKKVIACYWETAREYRVFIIFTLIGFGAGSVLSHTVIPILYKNIIDTVSSSAGERSLVIDQLMLSFAYLAGIVLLFQVFFRLGDYSMTYTEASIMRDLTQKAFSAIEKHSYKFFSDNFTGGLVAKSRRFVRTFEQIFDGFVFTLWTSSLNMISIFVVIVYIAPILAAALFLWIIFYCIIVWFLMRKKSPLDGEAAEHDSKVSARLSDTISTMLVIKMFAREKEERQSFDAITQNEYVARKRAWNYQNFTFLVQGLLMAVLELGGMYIVLRLWINGVVSNGTVVLVQVYIANIMGVFWQLGRVIGKMTRLFADAEEMVDIFELQQDIIDPVNPELSHILHGEIVFDGVTFGYGDGAMVFEDFSLAIQSGEKIGLVGTSGAGKSTITKLLLRFADPQSGCIRIDGQDIKCLRQNDVRRAISYVPQEPVLFHRSLRENIAYGKPHATDEEIIEAAKKAHAHEFIERLEKGYDTLVGERGVKLSGGERQRVALARAILKDAPILILDEATSSLDTVSEQLIQKALDELMKNKTVIVIAHRLSTIRKMNRIIVLEAGRVEEEGDHTTLLDKDGAYANLWRHQTDGFIE